MSPGWDKTEDRDHSGLSVTWAPDDEYKERSSDVQQVSPPGWGIRARRAKGWTPTVPVASEEREGTPTCLPEAMLQLSHHY